MRRWICIDEYLFGSEVDEFFVTMIAQKKRFATIADENDCVMRNFDHLAHDSSNLFALSDHSPSAPSFCFESRRPGAGIGALINPGHRSLCRKINQAAFLGAIPGAVLMSMVLAVFTAFAGFLMVRWRTPLSK